MARRYPLLVIQLDKACRTRSIKHAPTGANEAYSGIEATKRWIAACITNRSITKPSGYPNAS